MGAKHSTLLGAVENRKSCDDSTSEGLLGVSLLVSLLEETKKHSTSEPSDTFLQNLRELIPPL